MKTLLTAITLLASSTAMANVQNVENQLIDVTIKSATYDAFFEKFDTVYVNSQVEGKKVACSVTVIKNGIKFETAAKEATIKRFNQDPLTACLKPSSAKGLVKQA
ncbi:hypothetical protein HR060_11925 [Catenovulum sp. SM1970]|uniref:hypothetical protein n=1 Tax=Marinifaba aquimaris TaxID=2741323 RepID=UPI001571BA99|nr:hypothetical protein [Marinifaba aquimaris]NTS77572.1 hypothetical protein [Marinifaba aquimaris]